MLLSRETLVQGGFTRSPVPDLGSSLLLMPGTAPLAGHDLDTDADAVIVDSGAPIVSGDWGSERVLVRVTNLRSDRLQADLDAAMLALPKAILLPRCAGLVDVEHLAALLRVAEARAGVKDGSTGILPLIDDSAGVLAVPTLAAGHPRLGGIALDSNSLAAAPQRSTVAEDWSERVRYARAVVLLAATAAGMPAYDTADSDLTGDALRHDCQRAARDGFRGRIVRDPLQVAIVNDVFAQPASETAPGPA